MGIGREAPTRIAHAFCTGFWNPQQGEVTTDPVVASHANVGQQEKPAYMREQGRSPCTNDGRPLLLPV